jgi:hypothetical protein
MGKVKVERKKLKLLEIKLNPENPRTIAGKEMDRLVKSLKEFPEMMELREIVVDENIMILGGNMRFLALKKADESECIAKIVTGLTDEQKREFIIKDNAQFGEWDMDALANSWDDLPLIEWGLDLPKEWVSSELPNNNEEMVSEQYQILIECTGENQQVELLTKFEKEGLKCRALIS